LHPGFSLLLLVVSCSLPFRTPSLPQPGRPIFPSFGLDHGPVAFTGYSLDTSLFLVVSPLVPSHNFPFYAFRLVAGPDPVSFPFPKFFTAQGGPPISPCPPSPPFATPLVVGKPRHPFPPYTRWSRRPAVFPTSIQVTPSPAF